MEVVAEVPVGQRPRGINLSPDGKWLYILASDDNHVQVMDTATRAASPTRCPPGPDPELGVLHPSGNPLYVANEDDNLVTAIDVETRSIRAEIPVGIEPEGMGISPDGKFAGQHLRDHQHGAFHRHRDAPRSSPTCSSTSARASPSSPGTASSSTSRPRSAARSA